MLGIGTSNRTDATDRAKVGRELGYLSANTDPFNYYAHLGYTVIELFFVMLLFPGLPSAAMAAWMTMLGCRILLARGRRPSWSLAVLSAILMGALALLVLGGSDLFHPSRWETGKVPLRELAPYWFAAAVLASLVPAWWVVGHYRDKFEAQYPGVFETRRSGMQKMR